MNKQDFFESERLLYKGITGLDSECLVKWRSSPDLIKYFRNPTPVTKESHIDWYEKLYINDLLRYDFIVIDKKAEQKIGIINARAIDYKKSSCEISYMIAETTFQRKGFASEAILAIMNKMNKEKICNFYAETHKDNIASIKVLRKLEFSKISEQGNFISFIKAEK